MKEANPAFMAVAYNEHVKQWALSTTTAFTITILAYFRFIYPLKCALVGTPETHVSGYLKYITIG